MPAALDPDASLAIHKLLNPNHPAPWRGFTDITRILERDPASFRALVDAMVAPHRAHPPDAILCPESCGFLFGAPMAYALGTRLVLARRPGKLPRPTIRRAYQALGIGPSPEREMAIHADALAAGMRVLIVDDVLATGGTVLAALDLVHERGATACGVAVAVELVRFRAREALAERGVATYAAIQL
jgi:adenine phosphoribosyltransferase